MEFGDQEDKLNRGKLENCWALKSLQAGFTSLHICEAFERACEYLLNS